MSCHVILYRIRFFIVATDTEDGTPMFGKKEKRETQLMCMIQKNEREKKNVKL